MAAARDRAARLRARRRDLEEAAQRATTAPDARHAGALRFARALRGHSVAIIAEVKRRSPSAGEIRASLNAADQAVAYAAGGAAAISVLTEPERFGGRPDDLSDVRRRVQLPVLCKDFLLDPLQLTEAKALGASAALLIVRALDQTTLCELMAVADALALDALVEIHTAAEGERALAAGARVLGVNNRDLETLVVDSTLASRLIPDLPPEVIAVAESGVTSRKDVEAAAAAGADAVLVGTALSAATDPTGAVRALSGVTRRIDRRR